MLRLNLRKFALGAVLGGFLLSWLPQNTRNWNAVLAGNHCTAGCVGVAGAAGGRYDLAVPLIALGQAPPREKGNFRPADLVELVKLDQTIKLDIRYATANNFVGKPVYQQARAFLQRPAALALVRAHQQLKKAGYGLLIFDGYRPWAVTKLFWDLTPREKHTFLANPAKGSKHNRGCAVDLSLYDLKTGHEVQMPGAYDEMTKRSYPNYQGGTIEQRARRDLLRRVMEAQGFRVNQYEWWHFDYREWPRYPILNISFAELGN